MRSPEGREFGRVAASVLLVSAVGALLLRLLDVVPSLLQGEPRGIVRHDSILGAERSLSARLLLPASLPATVGPSPSRIRSGQYPSGGASVTYSSTDQTADVLTLFQTIPKGRDFPRFLVPGATPFHVVPVVVDGASGLFRSVRAEEGELLSEVEFEKEGRRVLIRYRGTGDEAMSIAKSLRVP